MLAQLPEIYLLRKQFGIVKENIDSSFNKIFYILTNDLDLTTRSKNILQIENLKYVGDLIQYSENSLSKLTNMGSKCIYEIKREVNKLGLELDTQLENWPPAELEEIQKQKKQFYTTKLKLNFDQLNFLTKNIRDINLSVRVSNGLLNIGCNTISDLLVISKSNF